MMSKTHVSMGIALSMLAISPIDMKPQSYMLAIMGGALGGVVADIDILFEERKHDALIGQLISIGISAVVLVIDYFLKLGICQSIADRNIILVFSGGMLYVILIYNGMQSDHRAFTHSLLSLILFTIAVYMISPLLAAPYSIGYLSHILLDILNKKRVKVFFPKGEGFCLNLCYADKFANRYFMWFGLVVSILLLGYSCFAG